MRRAFGLFLVLIGVGLWFLPADMLLPNEYARFTFVKPLGSAAFVVLGVALVLRPHPPAPKTPEKNAKKK